MKPTFVILGISVAANAVLAAILVVPSGGRGLPAADGRVLPAGAAAEAPAPVDVKALADALGSADPGAADGVTRLAALFNSGDPHQLVSALRAAGFSEELVRTIVREQIAARYRARIRAVQEAAGGADRPYWQNSGRMALTAEQRGQIRDLQREMRDAIDDALGDNATGGRSNGRFAYLPADKAEQLALLESDYNELMRESRDSMQDFRLPSDRDALQMLQEERRRDIAALLSPEELAQFDQRNSPSAQRIRNEYGALLRSEDEYLTLYNLQKAFDAQFANDGDGSDFNRRERTTAEEALRRQILDFLGPERAAQYAQQRDPDYRMMQAATQRLNLPAGATTSVMDIRAQAATESQRISADASLDPTQRQAALTQLAARARTDLQGVMGQEGGQAFAQSAAWLRALERGGSFTVRAEGGVAINNGGRGGRGGNGARGGGGGRGN